ncbi:NADH dehydrogenase [ubiquinone] 1 alpha subcomplex subunit 10, mitochondrial [Anoplophora glabripennis]|uniref:NADH dehydrogenase [ubiquinone] 1 alpha subcomplex subunit 10, mitochondrial n=1 Tax=Anoplophora glabripennis TaxID=217634 RepID=V5G650_ANOGL|nr:NADH dehydrogenase [ubiquinone] 1 alpha subcomplex subunit 10, mitochondrial [Anoplophora glabripennis]
MSSLIRVNLRRILFNNDNLLDATRNIKLSRSITSRSTRSVTDSPHKPKPWPYQNKSYTLLNYFFDKTTARLDENSKIIVVDGPVASGKTKFAKQLASELEMLYLPEANLDMVYINSYGYDLRKLDALLPESCRSFDVMDFLRNPKHRHTARFQIQQYIVRLSQYVDALAHLFSTGQGVILDRSVYSDFVFTEAMFAQGYLSKLAHKKYYEFRDCTIGELLRPHLVIYLDVPVPKILENIKKRSISYEKDSPVLNSQYLGVMEKQYKQNYLKEISKHAELLVYDWSDEGDVEIVIEDIERIDFNRYDIQDPHLKDWVYYQEEEWACLRHKYADQKDSILNYCNVPCYEVPELIVEALEADTYHKVMAEAPGEQYEIGYNSAVGDKGILFKTSIPHRDTLPLRERRSVSD